MKEFNLQIVIVIAFILILASLFSGLYFVMKDKGKTNRAVNALTFRIGFSILLFLFIIISYKMGWIHPADFPVSGR
uniref:Twin transmembrane helix small protein n=1 Tax=mine drainage metagenome TaxID=410659 RepID=E6PTN5_9ZZZZ